MLKRIMVIVESLDINDSSGTKGRISLIKNLDKCGFELLICHYTQKDVDLNSINLNHINCIAISEKKWTLHYFLSRTERIFTRISKISLNPYLENWFGFSFTFLNDSNSIAIGIKKQLGFKPDLVLTLSKGASFRSHHALLKLPELHHKWMAYVHDPYPFHYYPRPYNWIQPGYAQKEKFFRKVSEKAKYSAFPSQLLQEWMGSYFHKFQESGILIPHQLDGVNCEGVHLPDYFNKDKFTLLHAGNLMKQRNPIALIEAYKKLLLAYPESRHNTQLMLLGPSSYYAKELEPFSLETESLVVRNENIPFKEVLALQQKVSVNIILESKAEISPFLPGKFPHCVEANQPILLLSPYYSEARRLLGDDYPYWSEADDVETIYSHLQSLYEAWLENNLEQLERTDLIDYLSVGFLKKQLMNLEK